MQRLVDLGEREIIRALLARRYGAGPSAFGDDCVVLPQGGAGSVYLASTDPAPRPVACDFGYDEYYFWGWLLAAINLSDIAAAGATPTGLLTSLTLPSDTLVEDFNRLLNGIDDACAAVGTVVLGGNLKEAVDNVIRCEGTSFGSLSGAAMSRRGAAPGDVLVAFGPTGAFWGAYMALTRGVELSSMTHLQWLEDKFLRPIPQTRVGEKMRTRGVASAATDASDGLYAAVCGLTTDQGLGATLVPFAWKLPSQVRQIAAQLNLPQERLALGFGDLQLVCAVPPSQLDGAREVAAEESVHFLILGTVTAESEVCVRVGDGVERRMNNFDNERFSPESQFTGGMEAYANRLLTRPLVAPAQEH